VHRQWTKVGFVRPPEDNPGQPMFNEIPPPSANGFRNFVHVGDPDQLTRHRIDYVIFHRDLDAELPNRQPRPRPSVAEWIARYREMYGPPVYRDALIVAFDVRKDGRPR
jgi:hypothetical protein